MSFLKGVHHIAVICSDYAISKKFYTEILGFNIVQEIFRQERNSYKLDLSLHGDYLLELFSFPSVPKRVSGPEAAGLRHLAFKVEHLEDVLDLLRKKNIHHEVVRTDEHTGKKFTFIFDPDDLPIELYEE